LCARLQPPVPPVVIRVDGGRSLAAVGARRCWVVLWGPGACAGGLAGSRTPLACRSLIDVHSDLGGQSSLVFLQEAKVFVPRCATEERGAALPALRHASEAGRGGHVSRGRHVGPPHSVVTAHVTRVYLPNASCMPGCPCDQLPLPCVQLLPPQPGLSWPSVPHPTPPESHGLRHEPVRGAGVCVVDAPCVPHFTDLVLAWEGHSNLPSLAPNFGFPTLLDVAAGAC
jgi:hypothetical protein